MMYCVEMFRKRGVEALYRSYIADSIRYVSQGKFMRSRFSDMVDSLDPRSEIDVDATIEHVIGLIEGSGDESA